jgi:hypothetical protein
MSSGELTADIEEASKFKANECQNYAIAGERPFSDLASVWVQRPRESQEVDWSNEDDPATWAINIGNQEE